MDRRGFLQTLVGGVVAGAAIRTWPFRVYSFPTEIVQPPLIVNQYSYDWPAYYWPAAHDHRMIQIVQQMDKDLERAFREHTSFIRPFLTH